MIIKDVNGLKLSLTKTRLTEVDTIDLGCPGYYLPLQNLLEPSTSLDDEGNPCSRVLILLKEKDLYWDPHPEVIYDPVKFKIGCRTFSPATFAKILKAAGVRKTNKVARKKKRAKN